VPADAESVELGDDGGLNGWRSVASAVGWFAGTLPADEVAAFRRLADAVRGEPAPSVPDPPGAPTETIEVADGELVRVTGALDGADTRPVDAARRGGAGAAESAHRISAGCGSRGRNEPSSSTAATTR
jgi:hypothetical protein